jgi:hypothetical protein
VKVGLQRIFRIILVVIAVSAGLITLLSLLVQDSTLSLLRAVFVEWTVIVAAFTMLLGVANVLRVHAQRIQQRKGTVYSLVLVLSFLAVFVPGILSPNLVPETLRDWTGPMGHIIDFAFRYVQRPLQSTLFSLMAFFVVTAALRAFRIRSAASFVMFVAALFVLLGSARLSLFKSWDVFVETRDWILGVPVLAGARGIILGLALGTVVTGLRLLLGIERPYSE